MADVIFYSTGEIFWVTDPPSNRNEHIGVQTRFPPVPPDEFFTYAMAANSLRDAGHRIAGAFGRQRADVRASAEESGFAGDPEILALSSLRNPANTVLVLIATESGTHEEGGVDRLSRLPFTEAEREAVASYQDQGGGIYVTWDHGQLGYETLKQIGLHEPITPEPEEPIRPNVAHSLDSTDSGTVTIQGVKLKANGEKEAVNVDLSLGPPAGYLQRIIPAQLIHKTPNGKPDPQTPHAIFNGVGSHDGIWIPAHMHEGLINAKVHVGFKLDESNLPEGVRVLACHIPLNETSFHLFPVMAIRPGLRDDGPDANVRRGAVLWDSSFHHICDINWSSDGQVPWEPWVPFSAASLWQPQFPADIFEKRLNEGMGRLFANAIAWLGNELTESPSMQAGQYEVAAGFAGDGRQNQKPSAEDVPEYI